MQWDLQCSGTVLRVPGLKDSKYTRGVVAFVTGSQRYPGAALLGVSAATEAGAGYVRYVGPQRCEDAILAAHPEVVFGEGTANAWVVGSGMDSAIAESGRRMLILSLLPGSSETEDRGRDGALPYVVMDAGALGAFYTAAKAAPDSPIIARTVITPHSGEAAALARALGYDVHHGEIESSPRVWAQILADRLGCVCVLKGADTVIATAGRPGDILEYTQGTHWLATAGTGDVLAGIIGTVLAQNASRIDSGELTLAQVAATGVALHGLAGSLAARDAMALGSMGLLPFLVTTNGGPINASDVIANISLAYEIIANPNAGTFATVRALIDPAGELERRYQAAFEPGAVMDAQSAAPQGAPAAAQAAAGAPAAAPNAGAVPDFGEPARPSKTVRAGSGTVVVPGSQARLAGPVPTETTTPAAPFVKGGSGRIAVPGGQAPKAGSGRISVPGSQAPKGGSGRIAVPGAQAPRGGSGRIAVPGTQAPKAGSGRISVPGTQAPKALPVEKTPIAKPFLKGGSGKISVPGSQIINVTETTVIATPAKGGSGRVSVPGSQSVLVRSVRYVVPAPGAPSVFVPAAQGTAHGAAERFVPGSYRDGTQGSPVAAAAAPAPVAPPRPLPQNVEFEPKDDGTVDVVVPIKSMTGSTVDVSRSRSRVFDPAAAVLRPTAEPAMKKPGDDPKKADEALEERDSHGKKHGKDHKGKHGKKGHNK